MQVHVFQHIILVYPPSEKNSFREFLREKWGAAVYGKAFKNFFAPPTPLNPLFIYVAAPECLYTASEPNNNTAISCTNAFL